MPCQDQVQHSQRVAGKLDRTRPGRSILPRNQVSRLSLVLAFLLTGCMRFTYDETATPAFYVAPSPTPTPTLVGTILPVGTQPPPSPEPTPTAAPTVQGPAVLRIDPPVVNLAVGETCLVQVWLDNVEGLQSIELQVGFDPRYVRIEDTNPEMAGVQVGAGIIPMPTNVIQNEVDDNAGLISYHAAQAPGNPVSGSGMVASMIARALADGGSPLSLGVAYLRGPEDQLLPAPRLVDGLVVVGTGEGLPEPSPMPTYPVPSNPAPTTDVYHTVQAGENLFRIALRYGTSVDAIVAANNLTDAHAISAGQRLRIPANPTAGAETYVVLAGDTLFSIARRFGTTVEELAALNGLAPPYALAVGQELIVSRP